MADARMMRKTPNDSRLIADHIRKSFPRSSDRCACAHSAQAVTPEQVTYAERRPQSNRGALAMRRGSGMHAHIAAPPVDESPATMMARSALRARAGIAVLTVFALFATVESFRQARPVLFGRVPVSPTAASEQRFAGLKAALPPRGLVGYLSPVPPDKVFRGTANVAQFYLTQYALVPLLVVNDPHQAYVVGNFFHGSAAQASRYPDLETARDFGHGVMLFRRRTP
jgi:hypothetical protein